MKSLLMIGILISMGVAHAYLFGIKQMFYDICTFLFVLSILGSLFYTMIRRQIS